jgi:putative transposase
MSTKQTIYSADFKTKVVLELLEGDLTLNQVSAKYSLVPKSVRNWKKTFLENAYLAFNIDKEAMKNREKLSLKQKEVNELHRQLGKRTAELEWASKKLSCLDYNTKKALIKSKLNEVSIVRQCELCNFNRSSYYYTQTQIDAQKLAILRAIDNTYTEIPFYGYRKVHQKLLEEGHVIGVNRVRIYMKELGLKVIYPTSKIKTTIAHPAHKKYPYLLRDMEIIRANQVWSTDITYLKIPGGFIYLAAIIDWHSKKILSYKISNTMDSKLVIDVLTEALNNYGTPEIFNTDQGSQYTSSDHTDLLLKHGIKISMDGKGRATDNIAIERFWRSAKYEHIYIQEFKTIKEIKSSIGEYIDFYNHKRFHQTLNYKKPEDVYNDSIAEQLRRVA